MPRWHGSWTRTEHVPRARLRPGETGRASPAPPGLGATFDRRVPTMNDNDHNNNQANQR
jgi:hypothetical protein